MTTRLAPSVPRLVVDAALQPIAGSTFQPTGFPNLGAATFTRADGTACLLVESVQSMAHHLQAASWDDAQQKPIDLLAQLPYVEVVDDGEGSTHRTSSREEGHRLASAYVRDATFEGGAKGVPWIAERLGLAKGKPLDWARTYREVFELDPLCLLHGVFFSDPGWHGNPKIRRAVSAQIEATDVRPVTSGGVKRDDASITAGGEDSGQTSVEGYGFIPFSRTEYTAGRITLSAVVDLQQIRGYGLPEEATTLLEHLALWEVAMLVTEPLRLRTACDLDVDGVAVRRPGGMTLPPAAELAAAIEASTVTFNEPGARVVRWSAPKGKRA